MAMTYKNLIQIAYLLFQILQTSNLVTEPLVLTVELFVLVLLYFEASKLYHSLRLIKFSQTYELHFKVIDLIISLLIIAHFMVSNN